MFTWGSLGRLVAYEFLGDRTESGGALGYVGHDFILKLREEEDEVHVVGEAVKHLGAVRDDLVHLLPQRRVARVLPSPLLQQLVYVGLPQEQHHFLVVRCTHHHQVEMLN